MSHFTRIRTKIANQEMLLRALEDLGYSAVQNYNVRGYQGNTLQADVVVRLPGQYDIGFVKQGDTYEIVADWWGVRQYQDLVEKSFAEKVTQRYAYHQVVAEVAKQGYQIAQETQSQDGTVKITVRRWT